MNDASAINIAIDSLSVAISLILFLCLLLGGNRSNKLNTPFIGMLLTNLVLLASAITSWVYDGVISDFSYQVLVVSNFMLYFCWYIVRTLTSIYLFTFTSLRTKVSRLFPIGFCIVGIVSVSLLIISQFTGLFYTIDESHIFQRSNLFWLAYVGPFLLFPLDLTMLLLHRKALGTKSIALLLTYEAMPMIALVIMIFHFGVLVLNASLTLSLMILYISVQIEENKRLEMELADSRVNVMLSQIQPHFMYNTLTAIENLYRNDGQQAEKLINYFSNYLRNIMDSLDQKELVTFDHELENIKVYLNIEKIRFRERLNVAFDLEATDFYLPILTVQPLVENAVRHGVTKRLEGGTVTISTRSEPEWIKITVADDGVGFIPPNKKDRRSHVGVENVRNRLDAQCGGTLKIESIKGVGTTATVLIPRKG